MRRIDNLLRSMARWGSRWGRQAGLLPYRPERSTVERWERDYRSGGLDYFTDLEEIARYGVVSSYVGSAGTESDVVDLGCGVGLLLSHFPSRRLGRYLGVDMSAAAIERATAAANERVRFVVGDALSVDLPDCDVVVLNEILYYVAQPELLLDRIDGCLRPGGRVVTSMWRHPGDWRLWRLMDVRFDRLDMVDVRSRSNTRSRKGWRIACHRSFH